MSGQDGVGGDVAPDAPFAEWSPEEAYAAACEGWILTDEGWIEKLDFHEDFEPALPKPYVRLHSDQEAWDMVLRGALGEASRSERCRRALEICGDAQIKLLAHRIAWQSTALASRLRMNAIMASLDALGKETHA